MPKKTKAPATQPRLGTTKPIDVQDDGDYRPIAVSLEGKP